MFKVIGLGLTLPLWLVAEGLCVYSTLSWWDQGVVRPDLLLAALVVFAAGLVAFFVGYALRDYSLDA